MSELQRSAVGSELRAQEAADRAVVRVGEDLRGEVAAALEDDVAGAGDRPGQLVGVEPRRHHVVLRDDDQGRHPDRAEPGAPIEGHDRVDASLRLTQSGGASTSTEARR